MIKFVQDVCSINHKADAKDNYNGSGEAASSLLIKVNIFKLDKK